MLNLKAEDDMSSEKSEVKGEKQQLTAKDLGLYLGCYCDDSIDPEDSPIELTPMVLYSFVELIEIDCCKPILRPLSDMTDEEALSIAKNDYASAISATWNKRYSKIEVINIGRNTEIYPSQMGFYQTKFLLSKYFDLFSWIDAGLAIDATELNPNPYNNKG